MKDKEYKRKLKELGARKLLRLYSNDLTKKQWKDLHKIINKEENNKKRIQLWNYGLCLLVIIIFALVYKGNYAEQISKCKEIRGHECTKYEIDKMFEK